MDKQYNYNMDDLEDHVISIFKMRGNEGKKKYFYEMIHDLAVEHTSLATALIPLVPIYGYWKDLWILWHRTPELRNAIDSLVKSQFYQDQESENPSMLAKWLPREGSSCDMKILARHFANLLFPLTDEMIRMKTYRKTCAALNRILGTTEVKMCAKEWDQIDFVNVPAYVLKRSERAFLHYARDRYTEYMNVIKPAELFEEKDYTDLHIIFNRWRGLKCKTIS